MKKLIILLLFVAACAKEPVYVTDRSATITLQDVNVGASANDGTGDPLRTAFQKVNSNNSAIESFAGTLYTQAEVNAFVNQRVADSLDALRAAAQPAGDVVWLKTDTVYGQHRQVLTQDQFADYNGTGGTVGMYELRGIVGTTDGFPVDGDSLIINTGFVLHPNLKIYRDGDLQWLNKGLTNNTGTKDSVYVFNSSTGTVIVRPAFVGGEKVIVEAIDPIVMHELIPEGGTGGGGAGGESDLLTNLAAYFKLDETSGTQVVDQVGNVAYAVQSGTNNQTGLIGRAVNLDGATQGIETNLYAAISPAGAFTVSVWVYLDILPSDKAHAYYLFGNPRGTAPYNPHNLQVRTADNKVVFTVTNNSSAEFTVVSSGALAVETWYHIVGVCNGTSGALALYIGAQGSPIADVSTSAGTPTGTIYTSATAALAFGNSYDGAGNSLDGLIDEIGVWIGTALSSANVTTLHGPSNNGITYPFN